MLLDTTNQDHWAILTALRGPDARESHEDPRRYAFAYAVKKHFTGRIRRAVGIVQGWVATANPYSDKVDGKNLENLLWAIDQRPPWWSHWFRHTIDALEVLRLNPKMGMGIEEAIALRDCLEKMQSHMQELQGDVL